MMIATVARITRDALKTKLDRGDDFVLVETLPEEYFVRSHLPGAVHLPYEVALERAPVLLPDKEAEIVVYCMNAS